MTRYFLEMFGISLLLTILLELPVGYLMKMRTGKNLFLMVLVNVLTNPPAVFLYWLGYPEIMVEIGVVFIEACIYLWFSRDTKWEVVHPLGLSITANLFSWLTGVLIQL